MEERSVWRASQKICLSPTAVSHALARLRELLDDELFIRTSAGMQPTARSLAMAPLVRQAWISLEAAIDRPKFEPRKSTMRFTIAMSDFVTNVMVPDLLDLLKKEAPLANLVIRSDHSFDLAEQMDLGRVDAAISTFSNVPDRFGSGPLFEYDDVLIASSSCRLRTLSLKTFSALSVVVVSCRGDGDGKLDGVVSERGLTRRSEVFDRVAFEQIFSDSQRTPRIAVALPHFVALPTLLEDTDLTAIVPRPLAKSLVRRHPLAMYELPYRTALQDVSLVWPERNVGNAPQEWLRALLARAAEPLRSRLFDVAPAVNSMSSASQQKVAAGA